MTAAPDPNAARPSRLRPVELDPPEPRSGPPEQVEVAIIGAGFAGIGAAIALRRAGFTDFAVLERGSDLGGTWRDNSYPGCRCDVPSVLYSYSFAPNPHWSASFSPQPEIWAYLRRVVDAHQLDQRIHTGTEVLAGDWDGASARWRLRTNRGLVQARVLISAQGPLSDPALPALPGLASFAGTTFHSADWNHDHDLTGRHVAVIGTGASAVQFIPQIQPKVASLTLFQRTAPWVLPRRDRALSGVEHTLYRRFPVTQRLARAGVYWGRELTAYGFTRDPRLLALGERQARAHLSRQVPDPALRAKLTPTFALGCKRVLLSNDYYPALTQPNVTVTTDPIESVRPSGLVSADRRGQRSEHPVDTIIFGTGFQVTDLAMARRLRGRGGRLLADAWAGGMSAYRGTTVAGFPNLFLLVGPNTGLGHTSIIFMIESQLRYVVDCLTKMRDQHLAGVEVRADVQDRFHHWVQQRSARTVWLTGGCASWYLDSRGHNTTLWPGSTLTYRRQTRRCALSDYLPVEPLRQPAPVAPSGARGG